MALDRKKPIRKSNKVGRPTRQQRYAKIGKMVAGQKLKRLKTEMDDEKRRGLMEALSQDLLQKWYPKQQQQVKAKTDENDEIKSSQFAFVKCEHATTSYSFSVDLTARAQDDDSDITANAAEESENCTALARPQASKQEVVSTVADSIPTGSVSKTNTVSTFRFFLKFERFVNIQICCAAQPEENHQGGIHRHDQEQSQTQGHNGQKHKGHKGRSRGGNSRVEHHLTDKRPKTAINPSQDAAKKEKNHVDRRQSSGRHATEIENNRQIR